MCHIKAFLTNAHVEEVEIGNASATSDMNQMQFHQMLEVVILPRSAITLKEAKAAVAAVAVHAMVEGADEREKEEAGGRRE